MFMQLPVAYCAGIFRVLLFQAVYYQPQSRSILTRQFAYYKLKVGCFHFSREYVVNANFGLFGGLPKRPNAPKASG